MLFYVGMEKSSNIFQFFYRPDTSSTDEVKTGKFRKAKISFHENLNEKSDRTLLNAATLPLVKILSSVANPDNLSKILEMVIAKEEKSFHGDVEQIRNNITRVRQFHPRPTEAKNTASMKEYDQKMRQLHKDSIFLE